MHAPRSRITFIPMISLLEWLDDPAPDRGIRFALSGGNWTFWSYECLAELTGRATAGLRAEGVRERDVVSLVQRSGPAFVATLFGAMAAGATPSPMAPPTMFQDKVAYAERLTALLATARPSLIVTETDLVPDISALARAWPAVRVIAADDLIRAGTGPAIRYPLAPHALLQFTSGSTRSPRGLRVPFDALESNLLAIRRWLGISASDSTASWLPVHHDMGLIGCLLSPVTAQTDLSLLTPEQFIRRPARYLSCFGAHGATLTAMPGFGLDYIVRRVSADDLLGLDFSQWRAVIVGAERIHPNTLEQFHDLCGRFGLRRSALLPAYGLAEVTLAVTGLRTGAGWVCAPGPEGDLVVGCGPPLPGGSLEIRGEDGQPVENGCSGEIVVSSPSVAAGYAGPPDAASATEFGQREVRTGDGGFLVGNQLFVLGRLGDGVKVRGRMVFAEDLEAAVISAGIPAHRLVVLVGMARGARKIVALLEQAPGDWLASAEAVLSQRAEGALVTVLSVPAGAIARTSSGKPKRSQLWRSFAGAGL